jgi:DNA-binding response OmpR family regulator
MATTKSSGPHEHGKGGIGFSFMSPLVTLDDIVVVIVEDDDDIRLSLGKFLTQKGATVFTCPDASEALQVVRAHHPNIVLSDIGLPNRDGFQLLHDIRSLEADQGCDVPIIAMSALNGALDRTRTINSGFQATLQKPFKPDQLLAAVVSTLDPHQ